MEALLIILMLILLSAASNWLKRRGRTEDMETWPEELEPGDQPPTHRRDAPTSEPSRPARPSWEEELRRLLEGERPRRPEPKPEPSPPVETIVITPSRPVSTAPPPVIASTPTPAATAQTIGQAAIELGRTRELQRRAAEELRRAKAKVGRRPMLSPGVRKQDLSEEIRRARAWFHTPEAARQAVMASIILGPPRALAPTDNMPGLTGEGQ